MNTIFILVLQAHDEEDQKYKEAKHNLRNDIGKLRRNVLEMIETNEGVPDLERLERHEFNMDLEGRAHLLGIREEQMRQVTCLLLTFKICFKSPCIWTAFTRCLCKVFQSSELFSASPFIKEPEIVQISE